MTMLHPIKTPEQHKAALERIHLLMEAGADTPEADELEALAILVQHYEREIFPFDAPTPLDAIEFRMEQMGYRQTDLTRLLGSRSRASEILSGNITGLSITTIRKLHKEWHIPADVLIRDSVS